MPYPKKKPKYQVGGFQQKEVKVVDFITSVQNFTFYPDEFSYSNPDKLSSRGSCHFKI